MLRPSLDVRVQNRSEPGGKGWLVGGGTDIPLRAGSFDIAPSARVSFGKLERAAGDKRNVVGGEFGLSLRWGGR
jgi:hypothetical protein